MPLDFPLNNSEKGSIENAQFIELKSLKFKGGLPVFTEVPTHIGTYGELVLYYSGTDYRLYCYLNGEWRKIGDVDFTTSAGVTDHGELTGLADDDHPQYMQDLVDDATPQLGGDLDLNGHNLDFPTTPNISDVLDEDTMVSNSATKLATQQSIKAYVDAVSTAPIYKSGTTSKNATDASGTQNIAHGLGKTPKYVRIYAAGLYSSANKLWCFAKSVYDGTTQSSQSIYVYENDFDHTATFTLNLSSAAGINRQVGVITFDATNIIITWTKTNNPTGTYLILWEAFA